VDRRPIPCSYGREEKEMSSGLRIWSELKTTDFAVSSERSIALLPVAAVEQHGPHLPLGTDGFILQAVLKRLSSPADLLQLPVQQVGDSLEHRDFRGTLLQSAEMLISSWLALGHAAADAGIRRFAIVNSHGGQKQLVDIVAKRLRAERGLLVGRFNTFLLGLPDGLFAADELTFGYHGGEVETSMMLAIAPGLVDMKAAKNFPNLATRITASGRLPFVDGDVGFAWQAQDLNPEGATGNAAAADAERGHAVLDHMAGRLGDALSALADLALPRHEDRSR
jgi:creatinine amidohydrolase